MRRLSRDSAEAIINSTAGISFRHFVITVRIIHHICFRALLHSHDRVFGVSAAQYRRYLTCFDLVSTPVQRCPSRPNTRCAIDRFVFHQNACRPYTNDQPQTRFGSPCSSIGPHINTHTHTLSLSLSRFEVEVSNFRLNLRHICVRPSVVQLKHRPNAVMLKSFLKIRVCILICV